MYIINTATKKLVDAGTLDLGLLPAIAKIDFSLIDGEGKAVFCEGKRFSLTFAGNTHNIYKTDDDHVSFRQVRVDSASSTMALKVAMDGVEILDDSVSVTYTEGAEVNVQADWTESDASADGYIKHKPSLATVATTGDYADLSNTPAIPAAQVQADWAQVDSSAVDYIKGKPSIYTTSEVDTLLSSKADEATTLAGYGIADAYTKSEVDQKLTTVYKYCGTVSAYDDLPASGMSVGDVYNIESAGSGVQAGDNVAWTGTEWDVLAGTVDLSNYLEKPETAGVAGQVLTKTATGEEWAAVPTELPSGGSAGQVLTVAVSGLEWDDAPTGIPEGGSEGQVLTKTASGEAWEAVPTELPSGGSAGQVLTVATSGLEWATVPVELPAATSADMGKILSVDSAGAPEWVTAAVQQQADWEQVDSSAVDYIKGKPAFATVATTGAYADLTGKPALDNLQPDYRRTPLTVTIADPTQMQRIRWYRKAGTSATLQDYNIEYSTDLVNWTTMTFDQESGAATETLVLGTGTGSIGDKVYFRGDNEQVSFNSTTTNTLNMQCLGDANDENTASNAVDLSGNLYSIAWKTAFAEKETLVTGENSAGVAFMQLFSNMNSTSYLHLKCNVRHARDLQLPAMTLSVNCYKQMLQKNTNLISAPYLPATTLAAGCYGNLFYQCTSLVEVQRELPARTLLYTPLTGGSYAVMYGSCSSLVRAPKICATTIPQTGVGNMFLGCTALAEVEVEFSDWGGTNATYNWLNNVAASGVFKCPSNLDLSTRDANHVPSGWTVVFNDIAKSDWDAATVDTTDYFCFDAYSGTYGITFNRGSNLPSSAVQLECSKDKATWTAMASGSAVTIETGEQLYIRNVSETVAPVTPDTGNNIAPSSGYFSYFSFNTSESTSHLHVRGDITTLIRKKGGVDAPGSWAFYSLFGGITSNNQTSGVVQDASGLILPTHCSPHCYQNMFRGNINLYWPPKLPSTFLADYCYNFLFAGCTSLLVPPELPAKVLPSQAYTYMFYNCTSLAYTPELTELNLSGTNPMMGIFYGCTSIKSAVIEAMPSSVGRAGQGVFRGCTSLKHVKVNFTSLAGLNYWMTDVAAHGVFECPAELDTSTRDVAHVPEGWTIVKYGNGVHGAALAVEETDAATVALVPSSTSVKQVAVAEAVTLSAEAMSTTDVAYAEVILDVAADATVTAGANLTIVDPPTAGKRNSCVVRWSGGTARLYVVDVEDLPPEPSSSSEASA